MRTIVDIPEEQRAWLAEYCAERKVSRAEAIREAIDVLAEQKRRDREKWLATLDATAGLWKDRGQTTDEYLAEIRSEWDR